MTGLLGKFLSFYLEFVGPLTNIKPIIELVNGRDFVTREKLDNFGKILCIFGAIPNMGITSKLVKDLSKLLKSFYRIEKVLDIINNIFNDKDEINAGKHLNESIRGMQDSISETIDFIRYDNSIIAFTIRIIFGIICMVIAPIISLILKACFYIIEYVLRKAEKEKENTLDKKEEKESSNKKDEKDKSSNKKVDKTYDETMGKLSSRGYNIRFLGDICFIIFQVIYYFNLTKLSKEAIEKIQGLENEAAKKFKKEKDNRYEKVDPEKIICDEKKWNKINNEIYKFNRGLEKAKEEAIKNDLKNKSEKKTLFDFNFFGGKFLGDLLDYLEGFLGCFNYLINSNFLNDKKN